MKNNPNYTKEILSKEFLEKNPELIDEIINEYRHQKEMNCSWYGPKKSFLLTMPALTDNYFIAKKIKNENRIHKS